MNNDVESVTKEEAIAMIEEAPYGSLVIADLRPKQTLGDVEHQEYEHHHRTVTFGDVDAIADGVLDDE